jgi:hypothetical protein
LSALPAKNGRSSRAAIAGSVSQPSKSSIEKCGNVAGT